MTLRQSLLKTFYPVLMAFRKSKDIRKNITCIQPLVSFYTLRATDNKGTDINFGQYRGKKILLVNTASDCGYTGQYEELEKLQQQHKEKLIIIAFPANDFKAQEQGSDEEIAAFCKANYGVSFPLMRKSGVIKTNNQNQVFQWLSEKSKNGWNNRQPTWNFCKYLVDEHGVLMYYFNSAVSPLGKEVIEAINR